MRKEIHPKMFDVTIQCACGFSFAGRSIKPAIEADICSKCHPLYTGDQKFVDTAGRIEKFKAKYSATPTFSKKK